MAKYGKKASKSVETAMRRRKQGTLRSGSGRKVTSRKQAVAIGLSEARKKGAKVPPESDSGSAKKSRRGGTKRSAKKSTSSARRSSSASKSTSKGSRKGTRKK